MVYIGDDAGMARFFGECDGGFDFWKHRAWFEITVFNKATDFFGGGVMNRGLSWQFEINKNVWHSGDRYKNGRFSEIGEFSGSVIFVDDGVDAF